MKRDQFTFYHFNPLPSHEGRRLAAARSGTALHFNPLPSHEGRRFVRCPFDGYSIFQSTPLTRGETQETMDDDQLLAFQSTPLTRGETGRSHAMHRGTNFNPLPSHEGRRLLPERPTGDYTISIHSPHTRGDARPTHTAQDAKFDFNPLPSHEGRPKRQKGKKTMIDFNPLPSHEGRRITAGRVSRIRTISIHSPHTRGDQISSTRWRIWPYFNPLPSHEGRLHVPHGVRGRAYFNPLPSHEGRPRDCARL